MIIDYLSTLTDVPVQILEKHFEKQMQVLVEEGYSEKEAFKFLMIDLIKST